MRVMSPAPGSPPSPNAATEMGKIGRLVADTTARATEMWPHAAGEPVRESSIAGKRHHPGEDRIDVQRDVV